MAAQAQQLAQAQTAQAGPQEVPETGADYGSLIRAPQPSACRSQSQSSRLRQTGA